MGAEAPLPVTPKFSLKGEVSVLRWLQPAEGEREAKREGDTHLFARGAIAHGPDVQAQQAGAQLEVSTTHA